jgi:hypothetical protein
MKVRCINNIGNWEDSVRLTVGKIYNVAEIRTDGYLIKNDDETLACYYTYRFEEVENMEKEKVLEIEFQEVFDKVAWRISYQNEDVLKRGEFEDDEIGVGSCFYPSYIRNTLMLLGIDKQKDNDVCVVAKEEAEIIKQRVDAINEKYGIPKRWRAEYNGKYFVIGNDGMIFEDRDKRYDTDNRRYVLGNYFKTKEEAQAKLEKIKQILKGE